MKEENVEQAMKAVFVVDTSLLKISPIQVPAKAYWHPSGYFSAEVGDRSIICFRGNSNKVTTYAGFASQKEAEEFKSPLERPKERKVRTIRRVIDILRLQQRKTANQLKARYASPEEFSEADRLLGSRFFSALRNLGLTYDDFKAIMAACEEREREKTGENYTTASFQLFWVTKIVGDTPGD